MADSPESRQMPSNFTANEATDTIPTINNEKMEKRILSPTDAVENLRSFSNEVDEHGGRIPRQGVEVLRVTTDDTSLNIETELVYSAREPTSVAGKRTAEAAVTTNDMQSDDEKVDVRKVIMDTASPGTTDTTPLLSDSAFKPVKREKEVLHDSPSQVALTYRSVNDRLNAVVRDMEIRHDKTRAELQEEKEKNKTLESTLTSLAIDFTSHVSKLKEAAVASHEKQAELESIGADSGAAKVREKAEELQAAQKSLQADFQSFEEESKENKRKLNETAIDLQAALQKNETLEAQLAELQVALEEKDTLEARLKSVTIESEEKLSKLAKNNETLRASVSIESKKNLLKLEETDAELQVAKEENQTLEARLKSVTIESEEKISKLAKNNETLRASVSIESDQNAIKLKETAAELQVAKGMNQTLQARLKAVTTESKQNLLKLKETTSELLQSYKNVNVETAAELQASQEENKNLHADLMFVSTESKNTASKLIETGAELHTTREDLKNLSIESKANASKLKETAAELQASQKENETLQEALFSMSSESKNNESKLKETAAKLQAAEEENEAMQAKLLSQSTESKNNASKVFETAAKLQAAEEENEALQAKLLSVSTESKSNASKVIETAAKLQAAEENNEILKADLLSASSESKNNASKLIETATRLQAAEEEKEELQANLRTVTIESEKSESQLKATIGELQSSANKTAAELESSKEQNETLRADLQSMAKQHERQRNSESKLTTTLKETALELKGTAAALQDSKEEIKTLQSELENNETKVKETTDELQAEKEKNKTLQSELEENETKVRETTDELQAEKEKKKSLQSELESKKEVETEMKKTADELEIVKQQHKKMQSDLLDVTNESSLIVSRQMETVAELHASREKNKALQDELQSVSADLKENARKLEETSASKEEQIARVSAELDEAKGRANDLDGQVRVLRAKNDGLRGELRAAETPIMMNKKGTEVEIGVIGVHSASKPLTIMNSLDYEDHDWLPEEARESNGERALAFQETRGPEGDGTRDSPATIESVLRASSMEMYESLNGMKNVAVVYDDFSDNAYNVVRVRNLSDFFSVKTKSTEVIVRVKASTVSPSDCAIRRGEWKWKGGNHATVPIVPGCDFVGRIVACGRDAQSFNDFAVGNIVASLPYNGGNARYVKVEASTLVRVPNKINVDEAACLVMAYTSAFQAIQLGLVNPEDRYDIQALKGKRVLVVEDSLIKTRAFIEVSLLLGAAIVYCPTKAQYREDIRSLGGKPLDYDARDWLPRVEKKVDLAIDSVGASGYRYSKSSLDNLGRLVMAGMSLNGEADAFVRKLWVQASSTYFSDNMVYYDGVQSSDQEVFKSDLSFLFEVLARGQLRPKIYKRVSLKKVAGAQREIEKETEKVEKMGFLVCNPWMK